MLDTKCYKYPSGHDQIEWEQSKNTSAQLFEMDFKGGVENGYLTSEPTADGNSTIYTVIPKGGGIFFPVKGAMFPYKCFPTPNGIFACNVVKSMVVDFAKVISKWYLIPFLLLINKQDALNSFNRTAFKVLSPHILKEEYLTSFSKAFKNTISYFLENIGFTKESSDTFAMLLVNTIEYDNAYRLRLEDIMTETKASNWDNPRKEIKRLLGIMKQRETRSYGRGEAVHKKFRMIGYILSTLLLIPKVNKALKKTMQWTSIQELSLDEIDTYWVCIRKDYDFLGMTVEEREQYALDRGWTYPPFVVL